MQVESFSNDWHLALAELIIYQNDSMELIFDKEILIIVIRGTK